MLIKIKGLHSRAMWSVLQRKKTDKEKMNGRVRFCQCFLIRLNCCQRSKQNRERLYSHIVSTAERTTIYPAARRWRIDQVHTERLTKSNYFEVNKQIKFGEWHYYQKGSENKLYTYHCSALILSTTVVMTEPNSRSSSLFKESGGSLWRLHQPPAFIHLWDSDSKG